MTAKTDLIATLQTALAQAQALPEPVVALPPTTTPYPPPPVGLLTPTPTIGSFTNKVLSGQSAPGTLIKVFDRTVQIATTTAGMNWLWNVTLNLATGTHAITVTASSATKTSAPSVVKNITVAAPTPTVNPVLPSGSSIPFFALPMRGVNIWSGARDGFFAAELGDASSFSSFLSSANIAALKARGFNNIRMPFDGNTVCSTTGATRTTHITRYVANNVTLMNAGFKVLACMHPSNNSTIFDGVSGTEWMKIRTVWQEMAAQIYALKRRASIAIEPLNEPSYGGGDFNTHVLALNSDIRAAAPDVTIFTVSSLPLAQMDGTLFTDPLIGVVFHYYPEPYSQQGLGDIGYHRSYQRIEIPVDVGARTAQLDALNARMTSLGVDAGTQTSLRNDFTPYYDVPKDATWVAGEMTAINSWATTRGLTGKVICSEWCITGDQTAINGADRTSRIAGLAMHRAAFETANIPWSVNELYGTDQGVGQGIMSSDSSFTFDDGLCDALIP